MSEYQYYEFQAIDRPLTKREIQALRGFSSRASITSTRFVNHYEWGDFKGDAAAWMEKYFDAFLYLANWGTRELMLRFPRRVLEPKVAKRYCCGEAASVRVKGDVVILAFFSEEEPGGEWDDGSGWLASLVPMRAAIAAADYRALYLGWLLCAQSGEPSQAATEPPVPPGLRRLTGPLEAFAEFLRIDRDLIAAAAGDGGARAPRTVAELLAAAAPLADERRRREAEQAAREQTRRDRAEAERRRRYLDELAGREAETWRKVDTLIATRRPADYDEAVRLLADLCDLAMRDGRAAEVSARIRGLLAQHARKPSFIDRLRKRGLAGPV